MEILVSREQYDLVQTCEISLNTWSSSNFLLRQMITELFLKICLDLYSILRQVAPVIPVLIVLTL